MPKIALNTLKRIIREEMSSLREGQDHDTAAKIMSSASKLLSAVEDFKESSSEKVRAEIMTHVEEVEKVLNRIMASPMQYLDAVKPPQQKVTLKSKKEPAKDKLV